jgi:hypothetical protein
MELITKYEGAVFFVDILGMSALTNNRLTLNNEDYCHWLDKHHKKYTNQYLAAAILAEFRHILMDLDDEFKIVTIAQLSDCAFAWSEKIADIVLFASKFMNRSITSGLLCRAGMTYGEIIETNQNHKLGRFIVGTAVTDAVKLERIAKGARVLIDEDFPNHLFKLDKTFAEHTIPLFQPFTNPLDYSIYDEFKWYLCPDLRYEHDLKILTDKEKVGLTKERLKIANQIRCSPRFNWNTRSKEGMLQLRASINFIAESGLLNVSHKFDWEDVIPNRRYDVVRNLETAIETDKDYRVSKKTKKSGSIN